MTGEGSGRGQPGWVAQSDANAQQLLRVTARFLPELGARYGLTGIDERVLDLGEGLEARWREALVEARDALRASRAGAQHPLVREDLDILIQSAERDIEGLDLDRRFKLPYLDAGRGYTFGLTGTWSFPS